MDHRGRHQPVDVVTVAKQPDRRHAGSRARPADTPLACAPGQPVPRFAPSQGDGAKRWYPT